MRAWHMPTAVISMLLLFPGLGCANPQVNVHQTGALDQDPNGCGFWGDSLTLSVTDDDKKTLDKDYCSSYGRGSATIVQDVNQTNYVFLTWSEGHGTNATTDYLTIYKLTNSLIERTRITISEGAGPTSRWNYKYTIEKPSDGGLRLIMTLRVDGDGEVTDIPAERTKVISIEP